MARSARSTDKREPTSPKVLNFLADFERLVDVYGATIKSVVPESDSVAVVDTLSGVAKTQVRGLATFTSDSYRQSSSALRKEADVFFERMGGEELMRGALAITPKVSSVQALLGISKIIELIKKIIYFILGLLFPHGVPKWIINIIEILDEIIDALLGQRSQKAQHEANQNSIDFLQAMRALRQLELINNGATPEDAGT